MNITSTTRACGLFLGLNFLLASAGCSRLDRSTPAILGGRVDSKETPVSSQATPHVLDGGGDDADPAVVALVSSGGGLCTGTLIAPRFVLTAQHCVEDHEARELAVSWGARSRRGARTQVTRIHVPPRTWGRTSDIAVVELSEPSTVPPVPVNLSARALDRLSEIRVAGYGVTGSDSSDSGIKRTTSVRANVTSSYVESAGTDGTCYGDSGGPAFANIDGREQLVAVTSHGTAHRCEDGHGRYVRTDVHRAFLTPFVGASTPTPPSDEPVAGQPTPTPSHGASGMAGAPGARGEQGAPGTSGSSTSNNGTSVTIVTMPNGSIRVTTGSGETTVVGPSGVVPSDNCECNDSPNGDDQRVTFATHRHRHRRHR
jgi:V8-like Glu-specific endopeptidase